MAIKLPAVIYLGMRAQIPAKKKWLTFIQNSALNGFLSLLLLLTYFMKLLLSLHSTSLAVKYSRCRIKLCCKDRGKKRSRREMGCLASHSESFYICVVSGALNSAGNYPFPFLSHIFILLLPCHRVRVLQPCFYCTELVFMGSFFNTSTDEIEHSGIWIWQLEDERGWLWSRFHRIPTVPPALKGFKCISPLNIWCC